MVVCCVEPVKFLAISSGATFVVGLWGGGRSRVTTAADFSTRLALTLLLGRSMSFSAGESEKGGGKDHHSTKAGCRIASVGFWRTKLRRCPTLMRRRPITLNGATSQWRGTNSPAFCKLRGGPRWFSRSPLRSFGPLLRV